jgi:TorA maturation chaperone TorD
MINIVASSTQINPQSRAFTILAQITLARSQVYRWLTLGFFPPDDKLINAINSKQIMNEITAATVWLGQDQRRLQDDLTQLGVRPFTLKSLSEEYARLFCKSAERISMRESTYRWREVSTLLKSADDLVRSLRQQYGQFGVVPMQNHADTLAVELEFMAFLCKRESEEWARQSSEAARQLRRHERTFMDAHLVRWYPEFCGRVVEQAQGSFYGGLAQLTDAWLNLEYGPGYITAR